MAKESVNRILENESKDKLDCHAAPVLILPNHEKNSNTDPWIVYKIADDKLLKSDLLPPPQDWIFHGTSEGWLATVTRRYGLILYKPFDENKTILRLPSLILGDDRPGMLGAARKRWLQKFCTFTPDPIKNPTDFICLAIFGGVRKFACIRPGKDNKWTRVKPFEPSSPGINDVVYHNDQFYAVSGSGTLVLVDAIDTSEPRLIEVLSVPRPSKDEYKHSFPYMEYLVESHERELLFIKRYVDYESLAKKIYVTTKFLIWKLSYDRATPKWAKLESLGQGALFIGVNNSLSMLASSGNQGCRKNCIYFTQDTDTHFYGHEHSDMGVYDLETKTFKRGFGIEESSFTNMRHGRFSVFIRGRN